MRFELALAIMILLVGGLGLYEFTQNYLPAGSNGGSSGNTVLLRDWSIMDAYVFSNSSGMYVAVKLGLGKPGFVTRVAVTGMDWMGKYAVDAPDRDRYYAEKSKELANVELNLELKPGVHTLVLRLPDDVVDEYTYDLTACKMNYKIWRNSEGKILVSVRDKAYPIESIGMLKPLDEPRVVVASVVISNIYVYRRGGNLWWEVKLGISLEGFKKELVELLARRATNEEIAAWARRVAEAIYESLLNGTSKAYVTTNWEVSRDLLERSYREGVLTVVFTFQASYIAQVGYVETTGVVAKYYENLPYVWSRWISGRYNHLVGGLRIEGGGESEYIETPRRVFCDDEYAVIVVIGETPYTTQRALRTAAPNYSLLEAILEKKELEKREVVVK